MKIARDIEKMKTYEQRIAQIEGQLGLAKMAIVLPYYSSQS